MSRWADDALWMLDAIAARLRAEVTDKAVTGGLRTVLTSDDWRPGDKLATNQVPAAIVALRDMHPEPRNAMAKGTTVMQQWAVVLAVPAIAADRACATRAAGAHLARIVAALDAWTAEGSLRPLVWVPGPRPVQGPSLYYFPLVFAHQVKTG